jgi:hypothetical protein
VALGGALAGRSMWGVVGDIRSCRQAIMKVL